MRKSSGLTQEGFAEVSGLSAKYYQLLESGKQSDIRFSTLEKIARAYGLEVGELFAESVPLQKISKNFPPPHYRKRTPTKAKGVG